MFVTGGLQNPQNTKEFGGHDLVRTIHRYSRFLALLGEKWGCVLYMGKNGSPYTHIIFTITLYVLTIFICINVSTWS